MNLLSSVKVIGALLVVLGLAQLLPAAVSWLLGEAAWPALLQSALAVSAAGLALFYGARDSREISEQDGFVAVTLAWLCAGIAGAMPYLFSGVAPNPTDAFFESFSGFTTTGASIFEDYTPLSQGLLLWRSMSEWMGGMGIIVLGLVILPTLGIGGMQLFKREAPGPTKDKLTPRLQDTAKALWQIYLGLTLLLLLLLRLLGLNWLEALNHAFTTLGTGGFSTREGSIGAFNSPAIEWVMICFMICGATNFGLLHRLLFSSSRRLDVFKDEEMRWFCGAIALVSAALALQLGFQAGYPWEQAWTKATFQTVSLFTTSGFSSDNYGLWASWMQMLLLLAMITGGCAGSTSGAVKWVRIILALKGSLRELSHIVRPRAVRQLRLNGLTVSDSVQNTVYAFCLLYLGSLIVLTFLLSLDGLDFVSASSAALSALSNIGPALGTLGPANTYAHLSDYAKWVFMIGMVLGRLELMTVFMLFSPHLWKK